VDYVTVTFDKQSNTPTPVELPSNRSRVV